MGLTAVVSSNGGGSATSLLVDVGLGVGGIFVAVALVVVLGYLNVIQASERDRTGLRRGLIAVSIPLGVAFAGIVLYKSFVILELVDFLG